MGYIYINDGKYMSDSKPEDLIKPEVFVKSITFNDATRIEFDRSDIIVFTGANNAGKSQLLKDIKQYFMAKEKKLTKIITDLEGDFLGDINNFLDNTPRDKYGNYWTGSTHQSGSNIQMWWRSKSLPHGLDLQFINFLQTENRLTSSNAPDSFDSLAEAPKNPIQSLFNDDEKEKELSKYFFQTFGENLIVDRCAGKKIPLFVGIAPELDRKTEDRASTSYRHRLNSLPTLQTQGDGMRGFATVLLDTFTTQHTITLIDEPEAFLHPPQARMLGKMLAKRTSKTGQLFIVTHSEDFLKGLLDVDNDNIKIIRIDRIKNINKMNLLKNEDIKQFWKDPILRYSNILSGLFHSKVVLCEGDSDCRFYQAMINAMYDREQDVNYDILFTHCGGKQRLKTVIHALKSLNVKIATICDIDALNDKKIFTEIIDALCINLENIEPDLNIIDSYVKSQRPQLDKDEVIKEISKIITAIPLSETVFPKKAAEDIGKIVRKSSAWSKVKETGKNYFNGDSYNAFERISELCRQNGLFIVPVGELERFYKPLSDHGPKWINVLLETVDLKNNNNLSEARDFVSSILKY
jgi:predicted ATPase